MRDQLVPFKIKMYNDTGLSKKVRIRYQIQNDYSGNVSDLAKKFHNQPDLDPQHSF
jgi:hypothetical protein